MKLTTSIILALFFTLTGYSVAYGDSSAAQKRAKAHAELIKKKRKAAQIRNQRLRALNERKRQQQRQRALNERNRKLQQLRLLDERKKRLQKLREQLRDQLRREQQARDKKKEEDKKEKDKHFRSGCTGGGSNKHPVSPACRKPTPPNSPKP